MSLPTALDFMDRMRQMHAKTSAAAGSIERYAGKRRTTIQQ